MLYIIASKNQLCKLIVKQEGHLNINGLPVQGSLIEDRSNDYVTRYQIAFKRID